MGLCTALKKVPDKERRRGWILATAHNYAGKGKLNPKNLVRQARRYRHLWGSQGK